MSRKHKSHGDGGGGGVNLGMIITPMLDMSFQLLAFFIMTYHPSSLEGHINGNLVPPTEVASKANKPVTAMTDLPPDSEPEARDTLLVVVKAVGKGEPPENGREEGQPTMVLLKKPEDPGQGTVVADSSDGKLEVSLKRLESVLKSSLREGAKESHIRLEGHPDLKHKYMMQFFDVCKGAGYKNVNFVAPPFRRPVN